MSEKTKYRSPIAIPPGESLAEILTDRGMTQADLAKRTNLTPKHINEVIAGKAAISPDMALRLETVLGIPASFWNNLEANYQEAQARLLAATAIGEETALLAEYNYLEMSKHGWLPAVRQNEDKVIELRKFFGAASLHLVPELQPAVFRKASFRAASPFALAAWLRQGEREAARIETKPFDRVKLKSKIPDFRRMCMEGHHPQRSPLSEWLAECGVALVYVPQLAKTYVTGATRWLTPEKAMVEMSFRGKWADIFWFSFFHELGHVLLLHSKKETFIGLEEKYRGDPSEAEQQADRYSRSELIPDRAFCEFRKTANLSMDTVRHFAAQIGIHPGVVVGRLEHEGYLAHGQMNSLRHQYDLSAAPC